MRTNTLQRIAPFDAYSNDTLENGTAKTVKLQENINYAFRMLEANIEYIAPNYILALGLFKYLTIGTNPKKIAEPKTVSSLVTYSTNYVRFFMEGKDKPDLFFEATQEGRIFYSQLNNKELYKDYAWYVIDFMCDFLDYARMCSKGSLEEDKSNIAILHAEEVSREDSLTVYKFLRSFDLVLNIITYYDPLRHSYRNKAINSYSFKIRSYITGMILEGLNIQSYILSFYNLILASKLLYEDSDTPGLAHRSNDLLLEQIGKSKNYLEFCEPRNEIVKEQLFQRGISGEGRKKVHEKFSDFHNTYGSHSIFKVPTLKQHWWNDGLDD